MTLEETGGGCFVATAAYSSSSHPDLDTFRKFRDRTLLTNPLGRLLVSVYYQIGPQLAQFVNRNLHIKKLVRFLLEQLAYFMGASQFCALALFRGLKPLKYRYFWEWCFQNGMLPIL